MVESSMPASATSRSDSSPVIQMSNFSEIRRVAPPRPAPTSMTVCAGLSPSGLTSRRMYSSSPGPDMPLPQICCMISRRMDFGSGAS